MDPDEAKEMLEAAAQIVIDSEVIGYIDSFLSGGKFESGCNIAFCDQTIGVPLDLTSHILGMITKSLESNINSNKAKINELLN